jgi:hypothetical protein
MALSVLPWGGPIYVPGKLNPNKEKLFFFYSEEDWHVRRPWGRNSVTVPTVAERNGDFSQTVYPGSSPAQPITIVNPATHLPFAGNAIPSGMINSQGQLLMNLMPLPNLTNPDLPYNYEWQANCSIPKRLQALKLDYHPGSKDTFTLSGRRWWVDTQAYGCRVLGYAQDLPVFKHHYKETTDTIMLAWTHVLNPTVVNEFNIGFVGEKEMRPPGNLFGRTAANYFDPIDRAKKGFTLGQLYPSANPDDILPQATFGFIPNGAYFDADDRLPDNQGYPRFNMADNLSWSHGAHTFKFGAYFERSWATDGPHASCFDGCFDFAHDISNPLDSCWDFSNALLGNFREYRESNSREVYLMGNHVLEWFAQDTWKVNWKLTLTYGVRFSQFIPWTNVKGLGAEWVKDRYDPTQVPALYRPVQDPNGPTGQEIAWDPVSQQYAPAVYIGAFSGDFNFSGMVMSTDKSYPAGFREHHRIQAVPRFGFSFDPFGNGKTAIRGGFAMQKEATPSYNTYTWSMVTNPPVTIQPHIFYGNMNTLLQKSGLLFPGGTSAIELKDHVPSIYRYSLGVQRDVGHNMMVDVSYVGNVARHLIQSQDQNIVPYGAHFRSENIDPVTGTALPDDFYRPNPGYSSIAMYMNDGVSSYNSLQAALNHRFSKTVPFWASYTYSHTFTTGNSEGDPIPLYRPWRIWTYGPANFDQTQMLVVNYLWDLPKPSKHVQNAGGRLFVRSVFDNWQVSGVSMFASGLPQQLSYGTVQGLDIAGGGDGWRGNVIARPQLSRGQRTFNRWFNTAAFALPTASGDIGNASLSPIRGPGQNNWDLTLVKKVPLKSEARSLQFRLEMYNAFNHTQYAAVDTAALFDTSTAGNPQVNGTFGQVVVTRSPRNIQLSVRLDF